MGIKKGDNIIVIAGADKGKTGTVARVFPQMGKAVVEGVNVKKKHQRGRRGGQKGQMVERAVPINLSNLAVVDPKGGKATRLGSKVEGGKKVRVAKKSGATLT